MVITKPSRLRLGRRCIAAFTIVEVMVAASIIAIALGSIFALNSQVTSYVRRGVTGSYASQFIQQRMEQFRRAAWTDLTSNYPPISDDPNDAGYDTDADETDGTVYTDDSYASDFPYDLTDLDASTPGLQDLLATIPTTASQLPNLVETVTVETYNASSDPGKAYTGDVDSDGNPVTVDVGAYSVGGKATIVHATNGTVTVDQFNPLLVLSTTIRLRINVAWKGSDGVTRIKETLTLFTVEGDK
jgi:type II secretory pathway pseudopilin PulG